MADSDKLPDNDEIIELTEIIEKGAVPTDSDFLRSLGLNEKDLSEKSVRAAAAAPEAALSRPSVDDDIFADLDSADGISLGSMPDLDSIISDLDAAPPVSPKPTAVATGHVSAEGAPRTDEDDLLEDLFAKPAVSSPEAKPDNDSGDIFEQEPTAAPAHSARTHGPDAPDALDALAALDLDLADESLFPPEDRGGKPSPDLGDLDAQEMPDLDLIRQENPVVDPESELRDMSKDALFSEIVRQAQARAEQPAPKRKLSPPRSSLSNRAGNDLSLFGGNQTVKTTIDEISGQSASQAAAVHVGRDDSLFDDLLNMPVAPQSPPEMLSLEELGELELTDAGEPASIPQTPKNLFVQSASGSDFMAAAPDIPPAASSKMPPTAPAGPGDLGGSSIAAGLDDSDLFADLLEDMPVKTGKAAAGKSLEDDLFAGLAPVGGKSEEDDLFEELEVARELKEAKPSEALPGVADAAGLPTAAAEPVDAELTFNAPDAEASKESIGEPLPELPAETAELAASAPPLSETGGEPSQAGPDTDSSHTPEGSGTPEMSGTSDASGAFFNKPDSALLDNMFVDSDEPAGATLTQDKHETHETAHEPDAIETVDLGGLDHFVAELAEEVAQPAAGMAETMERPRFDTPDIEELESHAEVAEESAHKNHDEDTSELDALLDDVIAAAPPISRSGMSKPGMSDIGKAEQAHGADNDLSIQNLTGMLISRMDKLESAIRLHSGQSRLSASGAPEISEAARHTTMATTANMADTAGAAGLESLEEGSPGFEKLLSALEARIRTPSPAALSPELIQELQDILTMKVQEQVMETLESRVDELVSAKMSGFAADKAADLEQISGYVKESLRHDLERSAAAAAAKVIKEEVLALFADEKA